MRISLSVKVITSIHVCPDGISIEVPRGVHYIYFQHRSFSFNKLMGDKSHCMRDAPLKRLKEEEIRKVSHLFITDYCFLHLFIALTSINSDGDGF